MIVSPASNMFSAISFGVFCRSAPSTSAIIRSRKVSPGFDLMRTLIQSEITVVPPVTAERSPPASRMTGALSPVMADSSTDATPSMTSPSPGMTSPARTNTTSPFRNFEAGTQFGLNLLYPLTDIPTHIPNNEIGHGFSLRLAKRIGLSFSPTFGHSFSKIGKKHRKPEPQRHLHREKQVAGIANDNVPKNKQRRKDTAYLNDEHDRIARDLPRV